MTEQDKVTVDDVIGIVKTEEQIDSVEEVRKLRGRENKTAKRFEIVDEQFISYYGGTGHKISNGECKFWLWHDKEETQKVCDKLNSILDENEQLKKDIQEKEEIIELYQGFCGRRRW